MTKSELIAKLVAENNSLSTTKADEGVSEILEQIICYLEQGERVEIRGFGSFSVHFRQPRQGRNPKTGENVALNAKYVPHFKAGKTLKERVDATL